MSKRTKAHAAERTLTLAELRERHPEFVFNIVDYLESTKHRAYLRTRLRRSSSGHHAATSRRQTEARILDEARRLSATVPALADCVRARTIRDLPSVDRDAVRADLARRRPDRFPAGLRMWFKQTSGSTGKPLTCRYSPEFYAGILALPLREALRFAQRPFGGRPIYSVTAHCHLPHDEVIVDPIDPSRLMLSLSVDERLPQTLERAVDLIHLFAPRMLVGAPYVLDRIARAARDSGRAPAALESVIVSSGASLTVETRDLLRQALGGEVINVYGSTEFGVIGVECSYGSGFHVDEGTLVLETLASDGAVTKELEEGELTVSSTANTAMPLLRYRTGDIGRIDSRPCACGRSSRRIIGDFGQRIACWRFSDGSELIPTQLHELYSIPAVNRFQARQVGEDHVELKVEVGSSDRPQTSVLDEAGARVRRHLPRGVRVTVVAAELAAEHNLQRYVTEIP